MDKLHLSKKIDNYNSFAFEFQGQRTNFKKIFFIVGDN